MIRAFITTWSTVVIDGVTHVKNPITLWAEANEASVPAGTKISMLYPDADANGFPDKAWVLVIAESTGDIEIFNSIAGVFMVLPSSYSTSLIGLSKPQQNSLKKSLTDAGLPVSIYDNAVTYGDLLEGIASYLIPGFQGFGVHIESEFV